MRPALITTGIAVVLVAAIALIVVGIVCGGGWRWAGGAATAALGPTVVLPHIKHQEGEQK